MRSIYLDGRWAKGCRNAALLWRELVDLGFCGRPGIVRKWAESRRKAEPRADAKLNGMTGQLPATCQLARLLMANGDALPKASGALLRICWTRFHLWLPQLPWLSS